jgi:hypothetical protein
MADSPSDNLWTEPESVANTDTPPVYPYLNLTQTEGGHSLQLDDTPDRERVRLQHGKSGNFLEMHPNGDEVHKIYGDGYEIIAGRKNVQIKGTCNITIEGDCNMHVLGNKNEKIEGDYNLQVVGNMIGRAAGSKGMTLISDSTMRLQSDSSQTGSMTISAGDHLYLASDLQVGGSISADSLSTESRVNAGTGVYAGIAGVFSEGPITSLVSVEAPLGTFAIMDAVLMTDVINSAIYNSHIHISPKGPTGPPTPGPFLGL